MTKKSDEDSIHPSETAYDKAIKRMEEREAHILILRLCKLPQMLQNK